MLAGRGSCVDPEASSLLASWQIPQSPQARCHHSDHVVLRPWSLEGTSPDRPPPRVSLPLRKAPCQRQSITSPCTSVPPTPPQPHQLGRLLKLLLGPLETQYSLCLIFTQFMGSPKMTDATIAVVELYKYRPCCPYKMRKWERMVEKYAV